MIPPRKMFHGSLDPKTVERLIHDNTIKYDFSDVYGKPRRDPDAVQVPDVTARLLKHGGIWRARLTPTEIIDLIDSQACVPAEGMKMLVERLRDLARNDEGTLWWFYLIPTGKLQLPVNPYEGYDLPEKPAHMQSYGVTP